MQVKNLVLKMSDGAEIFINRWCPDEDQEIKGIVQLHHGLAEHSMRYDRLGSIFAENGYVFNAYDMRGHGKTAENAEAEGTGRFGKLADKKGFTRVVEDLNEIIDSYKKDFPGKKTILLGHSFGSFVSQGYIEKYGNKLDGCILCGTAGPRMAMVTAGNIAANIIRFFRGSNAIVPLLSKLSFGSYNDHIQNPVSENAWLSVNELNISMYEMDKWCGFPLTTSFYCDMTAGLKTIHKPANMKKIPAELPVYFIYGEEDPVGDYGKTIKELYNIYKENGIKKVDIKGYPEARHEIFNEDLKDEVENDVITWISNL